MKELIGRLIESLPSGARMRIRGRDDPDQLGREVVRLYKEGRYREAEAAARRLVDRQRERLGEQHPEYALALTNLALLIQAQGNLPAAEPLLRKALLIRREALGPGDPQYATSLSQLADLLQLRGELAAAEPLMRQALEIRKSALGEHHPDYATGLTGLALLLHRRGDGESAEPLFQQALEIRREAFGDRHPMVATALSNLGLTLQRRGKHEAAEPILRQAMEIRREALGEHHLDYAASLSHLGNLLFDRGDLVGAEPLLHHSVTVGSEILGAHHPDVAADLQTLEAIVHIRMRRAGDDDIAVETPSAVSPAALPATVSDTAIETLSRSCVEIAGEIRSLAESFTRIGQKLTQAGRGMQHGLSFDPLILNEAATSQKTFEALYSEAVRRASAVDLGPSEGTTLPLADLATLMDRVGQLEEEIPARRSAQREALRILDRVLALRHRVSNEAPLLRPVIEAATSLRPTVAGASLHEPAPVVSARLADGTHDLATLLNFIENGPSLGDHDWFVLHREVCSAFGPPLAAAAARGRLLTEPATPPPVPPPPPINRISDKFPRSAPRVSVRPRPV